VENLFLTSTWSPGQAAALKTYLIRTARKFFRISLRDAESVARLVLLSYGWKGSEPIAASLKKAEGGAFSATQLAKKYHVSRSDLRRRRREYRIIYWRGAGHSFFYPRWQFDEGGALLAGIQEVLQLFKSQDELRIVRYFLTPRLQLVGRRPLELLRAGDIKTVLTHARIHADENTW